jgi:hypothetical protein
MFTVVNHGICVWDHAGMMDLSVLEHQQLT